MKTSEVLKLAKQRLATNPSERKTRFICIALEDADWPPIRGSDTRTAVQRTQRMIRRRLKRCDTLEEWLRKEHNIHFPISGTTEARINFYDKMQVTRHAWVDSMIAEFAAQGD